MRHQRIILELAIKQEIDRERSLPADSRRDRRSLSSRHPDRPPHTQLLAHPSRRRQKQVRRAKWRKLVILVPVVILSLLLCQWWRSRQTDSARANTSQHQPAPIVSPVDALSRAIIARESTDNYKSLNPHSQALGLAQVMPANISAWSQEALGYRVSVDKFLNNPDLQKQIINYKLGQYWQQALVESNGDEELAVLKVASHWYSGDSNLHKSKTTQWYKGTNGKLHRYPSVSNYSHSILQRYKQHIKQTTD